MGILLREKKSLYGAQGANIGRIDVDADPTVPASVSITPSSATLAASAGATVQLSATVLPATATNKSVTWSSSDTSVATVDGNGLVTRVAPLTSDDNNPRSVTITARTANGRTASVTLSAAVLTLPANAWGVYDGINGARAKATKTVNGTVFPAWADDGGNEDRKLAIGNVLQNTDDVWGSNYLDCPPTNSASPTVALSAGDFVPSRGYTCNVLIDYLSESADFGNDNNFDCLFCARGLDGGNVEGVKEQFFITKRGDATNPSQLGDATNVGDGTGWEFLYSGSQLSFSGKHLITLKVSVSGATFTATMYLDGVQVFSGTQLKNISALDEYPLRIALCAVGAISSTGWANKKYNFFGKMYAASIYNRALSDNELAAVKTFYDSRYPNSN